MPDSKKRTNLIQGVQPVKEQLMFVRGESKKWKGIKATAKTPKELKKATDMLSNLDHTLADLENKEKRKVTEIKYGNSR